MKIKYYVSAVASMLSAFASVLSAVPDRTVAGECVARVTAAADFPLTEAGGTNGTRIGSYTYKGNNGNNVYVVYGTRKNKNPDEWEEFSFSFVPSESGTVRFSLNGAERRRDGKIRKLASYYDEVKIDGSLIPNGGFEDGLRGFSTPQATPPRIERNRETVKSGGKCLRAWSRTYTGFVVKAEKGKRCSVSVLTRPAGELLEDDDVFVDLSDGGKNKTIKYPAIPRDSFETVRFKFAKTPDGGVSALHFPPKANGRKGGIGVKVGGDGTGKFLYILHKFDAENASEGAYLASITAITAEGKSVRKMVRFGIDGLPADAYRPAHNAKAVYFGDAAGKKDALYFSRFEIDSDSPVERLVFRLWGEGRWSVLAATLSDKEVAPFEIWSPAPEEYGVADVPQDMRVKKSSALDLSHYFVEGEAGKYGRVIVSPRGTMAFEKKPDEDVRFKSYTMNLAEFFRYRKGAERKAALKTFAEQIKINGYNCVRMCFENYKSYDERGNFADNMDALDYFFSELKKNGVYVHLVITWLELGESMEERGKLPPEGTTRDDSKLRCLFGEPKAWQGWKNIAELQLNHYNPYTKLAWKDDPMFVQIEHFNELSIVLSRLKRGTEATQRFILEKWRGWLEKRYGTIEKLNAAWNEKGFLYNSGTFKYTGWEGVGAPFVKNPDWQAFALECKTEYLAYCNRVVRGLGYRGIIASENITSAPAQNPPRAEMFDSIIANTYYAHPSNFNTKNVSTKQTSCVGEFFPNLASVISRRCPDRPIGITEYNHCWWNKYRYEMLGTFAPYAAFHNMSMLTIHENSVSSGIEERERMRRRVGTFTVVSSPVARASEVFAASFFVRGDVKPAKRRVDFVIEDAYLQKNRNEAYRAANSEQMKVALITGFAVESGHTVPEAVRNVKVKPADMKMPPIGSSDTIMEDWFQDVLPSENGGGFNLGGFVAKMRENKILPKRNITDIDAGVFQTDTGEIVFDASKKSVKIRTPKSQLAVLEKSEKTDLGDLKILSTSVSAAIGITSLDGKPIRESSRLILAYATDEANTDMRASFDRQRALDFGKAPILLRKGVLRANLKLDASKKYAVYPLCLDGTRRAPIPAKFKNGVLKLRIDTGKLPDGITTMFEIAAE